MDDDFSQGLDQFWTREVRLDGYGYVTSHLFVPTEGR
jgi:hypothetical protein